MDPGQQVKQLIQQYKQGVITTIQLLSSIEQDVSGRFVAMQNYIMQMEKDRDAMIAERQQIINQVNQERQNMFRQIQQEREKLESEKQALHSQFNAEMQGVTNYLSLEKQKLKEEQDKQVNEIHSMRQAAYDDIEKAKFEIPEIVSRETERLSSVNDTLRKSLEKERKESQQKDMQLEWLKAKMAEKDMYAEKDDQLIQKLYERLNRKESKKKGGVLTNLADLIQEVDNTSKQILNQPTMVNLKLEDDKLKTTTAEVRIPVRGALPKAPAPAVTQVVVNEKVERRPEAVISPVSFRPPIPYDFDKSKIRGKVKDASTYPTILNEMIMFKASLPQYKIDFTPIVDSYNRSLIKGLSFTKIQFIKDNEPLDPTKKDFLVDRSVKRQGYRNQVYCWETVVEGAFITKKDFKEVDDKILSHFVEMGVFTDATVDRKRDGASV